MQRINLYSQFARPAPIISFLTWKRFWLSLGLYLFILIFIYLFSLWDLWALSSKKYHLTTQADSLEKTLQAMQKTYPTFLFGTDADKEIDQLYKELQTQKKILNTISNPTLFSKHLISLGNLIVNNVWLTNISILEGGDEITLKGNSINNAALQTFINNLSKDEFYQDFSININNISEAKNNNFPGPIMAFELQLTKKIL